MLFKTGTVLISLLAAGVSAQSFTGTGHIGVRNATGENWGSKSIENRFGCLDVNGGFVTNENCGLYTVTLDVNNNHYLSTSAGPCTLSYPTPNFPFQCAAADASIQTLFYSFDGVRIYHGNLDGYYYISSTLPVGSESKPVYSNRNEVDTPAGDILVFWAWEPVS